MSYRRFTNLLKSQPIKSFDVEKHFEKITSNVGK